MPLPVPLVRGAVRGGEQRGVGAQDLADLGRRPDEGRSLLALGVGVLAGGEAAFGHPQLAQQVVERPRRGLEVAGLTRDLPGVHIHARELRVVVEHLLEVRDQPAGIRGVAVETAAKLITDTARGHRVKAPARNVQWALPAAGRVAPQQRLDQHRLRELGRASPASIDGIESLIGGRGRLRHGARGRQARRRGAGPLLLGQCLDQART